MASAETGFSKNLKPTCPFLTICPEARKLPMLQHKAAINNILPSLMAFSYELTFLYITQKFLTFSINLARVVALAATGEKPSDWPQPPSETKIFFRPDAFS
jgi:hypothetical protein